MADITQRRAYYNTRADIECLTIIVTKVLAETNLWMTVLRPVSFEHAAEPSLSHSTNCSTSAKRKRVSKARVGMTFNRRSAFVPLKLRTSVSFTYKTKYTVKQRRFFTPSWKRYEYC